jgi:hypothetical protein
LLALHFMSLCFPIKSPSLMIINSFDDFDPTTVDHVHIVVNLRLNSSTNCNLSLILGSRDKSHCVQLDLFRPGFDNQDQMVQCLYSELLLILVVHLWPVGVHPVVWIAFDEMPEFKSDFGWTVLKRVLGGIREDLSDLALDVVVTRECKEMDPVEVAQFCEKYRVVFCTSAQAKERVVLQFQPQEGHDPVARRMPTRWSHGHDVCSLPFYERDAPWYATAAAAAVMCHLFISSCPDQSWSVGTNVLDWLIDQHNTGTC